MLSTKPTIRLFQDPRGYPEYYRAPGIGQVDTAVQLMGEPAKLIGWAVILYMAYKWLGQKKESFTKRRQEKKAAKRRRKAERYASKIRDLGLDVRVEERGPGLWR